MNSITDFMGTKIMKLARIALYFLKHGFAKAFEEPNAACPLVILDRQVWSQSSSCWDSGACIPRIL